MVYKILRFNSLHIVDKYKGNTEGVKNVTAKCKMINLKCKSVNLFLISYNFKIQLPFLIQIQLKKSRLQNYPFLL